MRSLFGVVLVVLVVASPGTAQQKPAEHKGQEPKRLRFDWPIGTELRVDSERSRERTAKPATVRKAAQRMRVLAHPEGRLVQFEQLDSTKLNLSGDAAAALAAQVQSLTPNFVIDRDGDVVGVENLAAIQSALRALMPSTEQMPAGLKELMTNITSEEVLEALVSEEWHFLVGTWQDVPLESKPLESTTAMPSPLFPDIEIPWTVTIRFQGVSSCTRGGVARECAALDARWVASPDALRAMLAKLIEGVPDLGGTRYERMGLVNVARIRLETATMLPHEASSEKTVEMTVTDGKERIDVKQVDRRSSRFTYPEK
jgi:hypothetical protein